MLKNYFSIALRTIRKGKLYAFINVFSLAIGLASCLLIYLFIKDERGFDAFHTKSKLIYRLDEVQHFPGTHEQKVALSMGGMGPFMQNEFPEIISYTRFWNRGQQLIVKNDTRQLIPNVAFVDSSFLDLFDFELLRGDRATALDLPFTFLLSEKTALKFFNSIDEAMNNTVSWQNKDYKIVGIIKDVPENSHLQFDVLGAMATAIAQDKDFNKQWGGNFLNTYFLLQPSADVKAMEEKFPDFLKRHDQDPNITAYYKLFLQPLDQVHLASTDIEHDYNNYRKFNGKYLDVFFIVAVVIILIAAVNFMNLTTARSSHRWKEIGVRKTIGAKKFQLFSQFVFESLLLSLLALLLAFVVNLLFVPLLNTLIGRQLSMLAIFNNPVELAIIFAGTLSLGLLTGIYPSFYMTSFNLANVVKGGSKVEGNSIFRNSLVVVQFGLALAMIVSTLIVLQQLSYMKSKDIGFKKDQIMLIGMNKEANEKFETMKLELLRNKLIQGVTASGQRLGNNFHQWGFKVKADTGVVEITPSNVNVDYDYLTVYGIQLKEGRNFSKDYKTDNGMAFIINESFANELGLKETIGTRAGHGWYHQDSLGTIIGVVKDFNFNSLHYKVNTLEMVVHPEWGYDEMSVKVDGAHIEEAIAFVKQTWDKMITTYPFDYTFLDSHFEKLYRSDQQMSSVVSIMAGLAVLISCMGLFGLTAITTEKKTKEIGIRKVLGATENQIAFLLSKNFTVLIIISFLAASPVTYFLLSRWLQDFAYRIDINPMVFILGGILTLLIALVTISYHTLRSARANPVKALRYE
jgi:putative ABC transport system permease protein